MTYKIENVDITTATAQICIRRRLETSLDSDGTVQANTNLGNNNPENAPIMGDNLYKEVKTLLSREEFIQSS